MEVTAKTKAITTKAIEPTEAAWFKTKSFAINPAVSGPPPSEMSAMVITTAKTGFA